MSARLLIAALGMAVVPSLAAQQQRPAPPPARPAGPATTTATPAAPAARGGRAPAVAPPDTTLHIEYRREVYSYQGGQRDPFLSLATTAEVGPQISDLRLVSVVFDARGGRSVAIVRDRNNPHSYRLRRGDQVGRLRVIQIRQYEVVFQVEEFGFERQETLRLTRPEANQ
jgi:hypothetical protein